MSYVAIFYVTLSAIIDIGANMMIEKSNGFRKLNWGLGAIVLVWIAFAFLSQAVKTMDLAVAYAMWGAIGVIGTAICGKLIYNHHLERIGWLGIALVTLAVIVLCTA